MTTTYPGAIDSFTNPTSTDQLSSPSHSDQHADANDAIEAIEAAIGVKYGARVHAKRSSAQSVPSGANTAVFLNSADDYDTDDFHETVTNPTRITIPAGMGGLYMLMANVSWPGNSTGNRIILLRKNGTTSLASDTKPGAATNTNNHNLSDLRVLAAGDYIELVVFQSSGGNLDLSDSNLVAVKLA